MIKYLDRETMEVKVSGYYGDPFQGSCGVIHGDPLSPRIFNVVVEEISRHWVGMVLDNKAGHEGFRYDVAEKTAFF